LFRPLSPEEVRVARSMGENLIRRKKIKRRKIPKFRVAIKKRKKIQPEETEQVDRDGRCKFLFKKTIITNMSKSHIW